MFAEVSWRKTEAAASIAEMDAILDSIAKEVSPALPQAIDVARSNGDTLSIVLGATEGSILSFVAANQDPPYFVSLRDPTAEGIFTFYVCLDHHTEALASSVVPEAIARQVMREFVSLSHGLPDSINWAEV
jgi:hypothetical protein